MHGDVRQESQTFLHFHYPDEEKVPNIHLVCCSLEETDCTSKTLVHSWWCNAS